jgi:hypothetical protein
MAGNLPEVTVSQEGKVTIELSPEQSRILTGHDTCKLWALQSRFREKLLVAQTEAALRSEAVL